MFKQFRPIEIGEFIVVGGDCSQGGDDYNVCQFFSKTKLDVPLIYRKKGVAAEMTSSIYPVLESIAKFTGVKPVVGYERNMGGASEMERLSVLNRDSLYQLFVMPKLGREDQIGQSSKKLGFDTSGLSRPIMLGELKEVIDIHGLGIYDQQTTNEISTFIVNNSGKPEASKGAHDDTVISLGVSWFMSKREVPRELSSYTNKYNPSKWQL